MREEDTLTLVLKLRDSSFSIALVEIMKLFHITVRDLAQSSGLSEELIKSYRNDELPPTKISIIQLCIGMKLPFPVSFILLKRADAILGFCAEDDLYIYFLARAKYTNVLECNDMIDKYNRNETQKTHQAHKFKEPKTD